jgi:hypothetical protein
MKRVLFLLVSAFIAGTSYCSNLASSIVSSKESEVEAKSEQSLVLEQAVLNYGAVNWHYSHSSHSSHTSHTSHTSHRSHYSARY